MMDLSAALRWQPPANWARIRTLDLHTAGEPLRLVIDGYPALAGRSVLERRRDALAHHDWARRVLMFEPRGHVDMYGCILTAPATADADFGVLFTHNEGYSAMCGHGIIAVTTALLELGMVPANKAIDGLRIDTPAGRVTAFADFDGERVARVRFHNVASFVAARDAVVDVPGLGTIRYDLVYGGGFYAYVDAADVGLTLEPASTPQLIAAGTAIKQAVVASRPVRHPTEADLGFLYGTIFVGPPTNPAHHSRNVCIFAEGEVDRSPTGTGVSGRCALHVARGDVALGESMVIESILGTTFAVRAVDAVDFGGYPAIIPEVEGKAYVCGRNEFLVDPEDPLAHGFLLR
ncbi:proline racemase family protein [Tahibacter amnicola]|uniref:Proline racemase family protein n=1 Tax=Tahibacter amnicola TaxID=2976241 RepID=A0ABY6BME1_9GAMM|nr:proline racemase family protein [Tahibacter amnicola]UXI68982.1 proline racemase family protein [Tahibacter amnicola]